MHDCRQTRAQLPDLVCDELSPRAAARLHAQIAACADCQAEHDALVATLGAFDQARADAEPAADFWPAYHARLAARLQNETQPAPTTHVATTPRGAWLAPLRRAFTTTWRVPAPVAAVFALAFVALAVLALRPAPAAIVLAAPPQVEAAAVRTVEVPVVREKIVTRTIYVTRGGGQGREEQLARANDKGLARRDGVNARERAGARAALSGFKPADDVRLRIIKGSFTHEQ